MVGISGKRFLNPNVKNIKSGILLSPGPVSNYKSVQNLSRVFHSAVTKQKFVDGATKLQEEGYGELVFLDELRNTTCAFVKKPVPEMQNFLQQIGTDLCTFKEYEMRYNMPPPSSVGAKELDLLRERGYLHDGYLANQQQSQFNLGGVDNTNAIPSAPFSAKLEI